MTNEDIIGSVKYWIEHTIIGFNFCPFAKREFVQQRIHYPLVPDADPREQLKALETEFAVLDETPSIETSVLILPRGLESFFDYLDFLDIANERLAELGYEGIYQLASFHPDYCFGDTTQDDPANYTNRSPYPLIHILREASLEKAIDHHPDAEGIPQRNIDVAQAKGREVFQAILDNSFKS